MASELRKLLITDDDQLRFSEDFPDALKLLAHADKLGLEGIVSKKGVQPYQSGRNPGWVKVKCHDWREKNRDRGKLFPRSR